MAIIQKPYTYAPNTLIAASEQNANIDVIYSAFNGNIEAANLATGAVTTPKIGDLAVTTGKVAENAITQPKLASSLWDLISPAPRISVATNVVTTLTPNITNYDYYRITAQAGALTIAAPTGSPADGQGLLLEIQDNGTTRALTWNAAYEADSIYGLTLPTATVAGKTHFLTFVWSSARSKWVWIS